MAYLSALQNVSLISACSHSVSIIIRTYDEKVWIPAIFINRHLVMEKGRFSFLMALYGFLRPKFFLSTCAMRQTLKRGHNMGRHRTKCQSLFGITIMCSLIIHYLQGRKSVFDYKVQLCNLRGHSMSVRKKVTLVKAID